MDDELEFTEFEVSDEDYEWLEAEAGKRGISIEDLVVEIIGQFLKERENDESI